MTEKYVSGMGKGTDREEYFSEANKDEDREVCTPGTETKKTRSTPGTQTKIEKCIQEQRQTERQRLRGLPVVKGYVGQTFC